MFLNVPWSLLDVLVSPSRVAAPGGFPGALGLRRWCGVSSLLGGHALWLLRVSRPAPL